MRSYLKRNSWVLDIKYRRYVLNLFQITVIFHYCFNVLYSKILFYVHEYFVCMYVYVSYVCPVPTVVRRGQQIPQNWSYRLYPKHLPELPIRVTQPRSSQNTLARSVEERMSKETLPLLSKTWLGLSTSFRLAAGRRCPGKACCEALPAFLHCLLGLGLSLLSSLIFRVSIFTPRASRLTKDAAIRAAWEQPACTTQDKPPSWLFSLVMRTGIAFGLF